MQINNVKYLVKIAIGLIFIASAILKLITIDDFEIYIFSLKLISLNISILAARLIIGLELFLGFSLILNLRKAAFFAFFLTFIFTIFLLTLIVKGNSENCNCFGSYINLTPSQSIVKNVILLIALFWIRKLRGFNSKRCKLLISCLFAFCLITPNIISPPDFINNRIYAQNINYDNSLLNKALESQFEIDSNEKIVVCFFSPTCHFCSLAAKKIATISVVHNINANKFVFVFAEGEKIDSFIENTKTKKFQFVFLPKKDFFRITYTNVPLIVTVSNKKVFTAFNYRNIDEDKIVDFIGSK